MNCSEWPSAQRRASRNAMPWAQTVLDGQPSCKPKKLLESRTTGEPVKQFTGYRVHFQT